MALDFSYQFLWSLFRLPLSFYNQRHAVEISFRVFLNESVAEILTGPLFSTVISFATIVFYAIVMFCYDVPLALTVVGLGMCNFLCTALLLRATSKSILYHQLKQETGLSLMNAFDGLQFIETIKTRGMESDFFFKMAGSMARKISTQQEMGVRGSFLSAIGAFLPFLTLALLLGMGSYKVLDGSLSVGKLMAFQLLMIQFLFPLGRLVTLVPQIQSLRMSLERLDDVLKNNADPIYASRSEVSKNSALQLQGKIEIKNISFRYAPLSPDIIKNVSFSIAPGKRIAMVGPSGGGKSTIARLVAGLCYPVEGQILYDGKAIDQVSLELFRNSVIMADQNTFLFTGTIRENLTFWNHKVPDEILVQAAMNAEIHHLILSRPGGYSAIVAEEGNNFSDGEKQRLEIARSLLYGPTLLILDDAVSNIDPKTTHAIYQNLKKMGMSILIATNSLDIIADCDEILVVDQNTIIDRGSHKELKDKEGFYQKLTLQRI